MIPCAWFSGEDGDYRPPGDEDCPSESGGSSDSDFSVSSPLHKKTKAVVAKPRHQKTATEAKRQRSGQEMKKTASKRAVKAKLSPDTVTHTAKPHTKRVTAVDTLPTPSPKSTTLKAATPGLGMRRMPHWTPPGEKSSGIAGHGQ